MLSSISCFIYILSCSNVAVGVWDIYYCSKFMQTCSSNCFTLCRFLLQDSSVPDVTHVEKQKLKSAFEQLKTKALQLNCWARSELEGLSSAKWCKVSFFCDYMMLLVLLNANEQFNCIPGYGQHHIIVSFAWLTEMDRVSWDRIRVVSHSQGACHFPTWYICAPQVLAVTDRVWRSVFRISDTHDNLIEDLGWVGVELETWVLSTPKTSIV